MKSKRGTYISELDENINYGERTLKGGSGRRPLCLSEKRLDAMPSNSKVILYRRVLVGTVTYGRELISFIVNLNVNDVVLVLVVTFAGVEPVNRDCFTSDGSSRKVSVNPCIYELNRSSYLILCDLL